MFVLKVYVVVCLDFCHIFALGTCEFIMVIDMFIEFIPTRDCIGAQMTMEQSRAVSLRKYEKLS